MSIVLAIILFTSITFALIKSGIKADSNSPPVANFTFYPTIPSKNETVIFNASSSYDPDGIITNYTWNFGDGSIAYGMIVNHSYANDSIYNVTLTVRDDNNATANITKQIIVDETPVANFSFVVNDKSVIFNSSSYDPDGSIVNYTWNFGDEKTAYGENVSHNYTQEAIYHACLTVVDNYGKNATICKNVTIDITPPSIQFVLPPINGKNGWYISKLDIKINAVDNVSGIKELKYKVDKGGWKKYIDKIKIENNGHHTIEVYAEDKNGNAIEKSKSIKIDYIPPSTAIYIDKNASNGWYNENVNVSLYSHDSLSGVNKIYYILDNQIYEYDGTIEIGEGNHSFIYYATDKAGNIEKPNETRIKIDEHAPVISIANPTGGIYLFGRKLFSTPYTIVIGNITIMANAFDNLSGIAKVEFYIDGILEYTATNASYEWNFNEKMFGMKELEIKAYDNAGNVAITKESMFVLI